MTKNTLASPRQSLAKFTFLLMLAAFAAAATKAQELPKFDFLATHYDVQATLHPADQTITAQAKVELVAQTASPTILVELHPDLRVESVRLASDGRKLDFQRLGANSLDLQVTLPSSAQPNMHVTLIFDYSGAFSNDDDSPTKDVRFAWIDKTSAYLLLPARWFPLTAYPSNRYTGTFQITVPDNFAVVGTGQSSAPNELPAVKPGEPASAQYTFNCADAGPVGSFVAGDLRLSPVRAQGMEISVFAPPTAAATASPYGDEVANIIGYYTEEFGPLPSPNLTLAQLPDGTVDSFSAPGALFLSAHSWGTRVNESELAHLVAQQWWGSQVLAASPADVWVTDGLAQYVAAMYMEHAAGPVSLNTQLTNFSIGAVAYEDSPPIAQANQLQPYSPQYISVVQDKGAMVFHMLRTSLGDNIFNSLLQEFYKEYAGKTASIDDFEKLTQSKLPAAEAGKPQLNTVAFFSQWLNSNGIPDFKMDYIVYRTQKGFKVVGKIEQALETFNMPVQVSVTTEGNPVTKTVQVVGTSTPFEIDTFGRPKPDGIHIDPDNNLLKASPQLQVRALIAKGEGMAEEGKFYEAIQQYQAALALAPENGLAMFRMGETYFYQKNYATAADTFRNALDGEIDPSYKWVEVWAHIYLGKIFDLTGSRERAINEYAKAQELKDNTDGAQAQAEKYMKVPYSESTPGSTTKPGAKEKD
jgi:Peptidase family M1 domain